MASFIVKSSCQATMMLSDAQRAFKELYRSVDIKERSKFLEWTREVGAGELLDINGGDEKLMILDAIRLDLQDALPMQCVLDSENIVMPQGSDVCGDDLTAIEHVDSFVYTDDDIDIACDAGKFSRYYCQKCGSRQEFGCKSLLDVGSRTGALLYGAHLLSSVTNITGIEINGDFCKINKKLLKKYKMTDRCSVVNGDIRKHPDLIAQADVVFMNNVFEFFADKSEQFRLWHFCLGEITKKSGLMLITNPSLSKSLSILNYKLGPLKDRLEEVDLTDSIEAFLFRNPDTDAEQLHCFHAYRVK